MVLELRIHTPYPPATVPVILLGICFWRKVREERIWAEYMGVKGGLDRAYELSLRVSEKMTLLSRAFHIYIQQEGCDPLILLYYSNLTTR